MKRIIPLSLLACLVGGGVAPSLFFLTQSSPKKSVAASVTTQSPVPHRDVFYLSDRFGFRFVQPSGYIITPSERQSSTNPAQPLQVVELWEQPYFVKRETLTEAPPLISLTVYQNSKRLPLTHWKGELSRNDDRPLTVAGQPAIAYTSAGLYESDNVLLSSPDGRYVFRLTAGYMDAQAPIRKTFQDVISSFTFDVMPDAQSASKWRINYTRLQTLLATQHWQAANLETQAILQRLAGAKGDLLFSSKSVLPRLPATDLKTLDTLWSNASGGRFGFAVQQRIWREVAATSKNPQTQVERFGQRVGWRRTQPFPENNPIGVELTGIQWRLDTELNYTQSAPIGHFPWLGVSSSRLADYLNERSLGCGSCTIDAIYLASDRFTDYLPALLTRFPSSQK